MVHKKYLRWSDDLYVTFYEFARDGLSDAEMAEAAGVSMPGLSKWKREKPALRDAIKRGRKSRGGGVNGQQTFQDWVYGRLPVKLQAIWDEIVNCDAAPNGIVRIEAVLAAAGIRARQSLFIHALIASNFVLHRALRRVNISRNTLQHWIDTDPDFAALHAEMPRLKKEFFEAALIDRVAEGDTSAVIFANKTINADLGYNEKVQHMHLHNHSGQVGVTHHIAIDSLALPLDVRRTILRSIEARRAELPDPAEFEGIGADDV